MSGYQGEVVDKKRVPGSQATVERHVARRVFAPEINLLARTGAGKSNTESHARALNRMTNGEPTRAIESILHLQRTYGNRYVQRVLDLARLGDGAGQVTPEVESAIEHSRGGGQALDTGVRRQMESAFGSDFSGVRVHTGSEAHALNRAVNAVAFTTGQDIFFRDAAYSPQSSGGKELLAHELTHVVQQGGAPLVSTEAQRLQIQRLCSGCEEEKEKWLQGKLVVGQPHDEYEQEADRVAQAVVGGVTAGIPLGNQSPPGGTAGVQRKCACGGRTGSAGECEECAKKRSLKPSKHKIAGAAMAQTIARHRTEAVDPFTRMLIESRFRSQVNDAVIRSYDGDSLQTMALHFGHPSRDTVVKRGTQKERQAYFDEQSSGLRLNAEVKVERPIHTERMSTLTDQGETSASDMDEDGIIRLGQADSETDGGVTSETVPGSDTVAEGDGDIERVAQVGPCTYTISYANLRNTGCGAGMCGAQIVYDITQACGVGFGCPPIDGLRLTESVTTDNGCGPGSVTTGAGCPIHSHPPYLPTCGEITGCTDTYALCGPAAALPAGGCTEKYTQQLFVGGILAETHTITFTITKTGAGCSGAVSRS